MDRFHFKYEGNGIVAIDPKPYRPALMCTSVIATVNSQQKDVNYDHIIRVPENKAQEFFDKLPNDAW